MQSEVNDKKGEIVTDKKAEKQQEEEYIKMANQLNSKDKISGQFTK